MPRIEKRSPFLGLSRYQTFIVDSNPNSKYFKLSELPDELTSGKNAFLIEGTPFLKPSTEIKIEVLDVNGNPLFVEPGEGIPEYYEGLSKVISIHVYASTPIGIGKITILGELQIYEDEAGNEVAIPDSWDGLYNVKWEKEIKINKNVANETRVRFVKRPSVIVEETGESFYSRNVETAVQSNGTVRGIPITPDEGTDLNTWRGGIQYIIQNESVDFVDNAKTISVIGTAIQSASIVEYLNQRSVIVQVPHTASGNILASFTGKSYGLNYEYVSSIAESSLFGSFARFEINDLKTFVGDVERLRLYGKSRATSADFVLLHDTKINSANLLTTVVSGAIENLGYFTSSYSNGNPYTYYWTTQSSAGISLDSQAIYKAVKFQNNKVSSNLGDDIRLEKGSEYTLQFYVYYSGSSITPTDSLRVYMSSTTQTSPNTSNYILTTDIVNLSGSSIYKTPQKLSYNFVASITDNWTINFEATNPNSDTFWHIGSVVLEGSSELGYSPDEYTFTIPIQRQIEQETFDFNFEWYDINNNYVPIQNTVTKTFVSGNIALLGKSIDVSADKLFFNFDGTEAANPDPQTITIFATKTKIVGNLLITSQAFDSGGVYLPPATFTGTDYPGRLTSIYETATDFSASLNVSEFTGSLYGAPPGSGDVNVDRILYIITENSTQPIVKRLSISRLIQASGSVGAPGADAKTVTLTSNVYAVPYDGDGIEIGTNNIYLTASQQNHNGTVYYEFSKNGVSKQNTTSQYYTVLNVDKPKTGSVDIWKVETREGSGVGTVVSFDTINLFGVKAGTDSYTVILTNESHTLPTTNEGVVNYTGSGTDIQVFKGSSELTGILSGTPTTGQFSSSYNVTNGTISVGGVSLFGNAIRYNSHSAMSTNTATIEYTIFLEGTATTVTKIQSLNKSFDGNDGANGSSGSDARVVSLTSDRYVFTYDQNNNIIPSPQTASISASSQNVNVAYYQFLKNGTEVQNTTNAIYVVTGSTSIPSPGGRDLYQVNLRTGSAAGAILAFDNLDIFGIKSGSDAYTVFLTNEAHSFSADDSGNVSTSNLASGVTEVRFFRGTTQYTYSQSGGTNTYRTGSVTSSFNITASQTIVNNDVRFTPTSVTGSTQTSGSIIIPVIDNANNITFTKTYTFSVSKAGASGSNALTVLLNPSNQIVSKSKAGNYQSPVTFSIQVFETGSALRYTGSNNTLQNGFFTVHLPTGAGTLVPATASLSASISPILVTTDSGVTSSFAVQYKDSKGNLSSFISQSHYVTVVKDGLDGADGVSGSNAITVLITPESQIVTQSVYYNLFSSASKFDVFVYETGSAFTYTVSQPPTQPSTFTIYVGNATQTNLSVGNNKSGSIRPPHTTTSTGSINQFAVQYMDSKGNLSSFVSASHIVTVNPTGVTGPGVVFTGPWSSSYFYQYSPGANNGRRDVVYDTGSGRYYATLQEHTSNGSNKPTGTTSDNAFWQHLGEQDLFVAAKVAIFEDSYVQNTLNVGTNNTGFSSANITIAGGTQYPYIAVGQSSVGYGNTGIWIGNDTGNYKTSFVSAGGEFLKWDGTKLFISGNISASEGRIGALTISSRSVFVGDPGLFNNPSTRFFVSTSGHFSLGTEVTYIPGTGLEIAVGGAGGNTNIQPGGKLTTQNAEIAGTVRATAGTIGGWTIQSNVLQASASQGTIILNATDPSIKIFSASGINPAVDISTLPELSNTASVSLGITGSGVALGTDSKILSSSKVGSSDNNTGGNIAARYTTATATYLSGSGGTRITGSWSASFTVEPIYDNKLISIAISGIGASGSASASFQATADTGYYISANSFSLRYGFALFSSSVINGNPDIFVEEISKTGTGTPTLGTSNTVLSSVVAYSGTLTISRVLTRGRYHIIPFVDTINISTTVDTQGGGCDCPSNGTIAYYGDCVGNQQEVYYYDGTCDNNSGYPQYNGCDVYLGYTPGCN